MAPHFCSELNKPEQLPSPLYLVEAATVADTLGELLYLGHLVSQTLLLIELLRQGLQLGEGKLERQPVRVAFGRVLQHVLEGTEERERGGVYTNLATRIGGAFIRPPDI